MATAVLESSAPAVEQEIRQRKVWSWSQPWIYLVALVACGLSVGPVLWLGNGGLGTNADLALRPLGLPEPVITRNYLDITTGVHASAFWGMVLTSTMIAVLTTAFVVILGTSVAYAIARFPMRGTGVLFAIFAAGLMFPATVGILPTWVILSRIGLVGSMWGVIIPQVAFALPTTVVILTPFVKAIPQEMEEAASIDGSGRFGFFFRILLPLAKPGMVTVGALAFVASWNAYMLPLFVLGVGGADMSDRTLPLGVQMFTSQYSSAINSIMAFTTLSMIPALVFFLAFQKYIVNGLSGAVKG
ncbi:MAG: carbohydrate ABC transporter permease [Promicromonosporaceae bacterium]|nr:carbohydrate ABC transporter permease [Promicromonosporaceae bacterium]